MPGRGAAPKAERRTRTKPLLGLPVDAPGVGWQHGAVPSPPDGLMPASIEAWGTWMGAWFAAFWAPEDLPMLRRLITLFDLVERGEHHRSAELRMLADTMGVTPKGQQDRRWKRPEQQAAPTKPAGAVPEQYRHLRVAE